MAIVLFIREDIRLAAFLGTRSNARDFRSTSRPKSPWGHRGAIRQLRHRRARNGARPKQSRRLEAHPHARRAAGTHADRILRGCRAHCRPGARGRGARRNAVRASRIQREDSQHAPARPGRKSRRCSPAGSGLWRLDFVAGTRARRVAGRALRFTGAEHSLLEALVRKAGRPVSKHELCQARSAERSRATIARWTFI